MRHSFFIHRDTNVKNEFSHKKIVSKADRCPAQRVAEKDIPRLDPWENVSKMSKNGTEM